MGLIDGTLLGGLEGTVVSILGSMDLVMLGDCDGM